jgi:membrane protease YdiL (CAAX protease family)
MTISDPQEQTKWNQTMLILCALFTVAGLGNNIMRTYLVPETFPSESITLAWMVTMGLMILSAAFAVAFGLVRGPATFETWGFVINRRLWISLVIVLVTGLIVLPRLLGLPWFLGTPQLVSVCTGTMEEVFFRGILITTLLSMVQPKSRWGVAGLICAAAAMFAIVHIPLSGLMGAQNALIGGILLGYIYYYTRSLLLPIFVHVVASTVEKAGPIGGVLAIIGYFVIAGSVRLISRSKATVQVPVT